MKIIPPDASFPDRITIKPTIKPEVEAAKPEVEAEIHEPAPKDSSEGEEKEMRNEEGE